MSQTELAGLSGIARNTFAAKTGARKVDAALSPSFVFWRRPAR